MFTSEASMLPAAFATVYANAFANENLISHPGFRRSYCAMTDALKQIINSFLFDMFSACTHPAITVH